MTKAESATLLGTRLINDYSKIARRVAWIERSEIRGRCCRRTIVPGFRRRSIRAKLADFTLPLHGRVTDTSQIFQAHAASYPQAFARFLDPPQKARIVLKPIFEPVVFRFKSDQHAGRLAVPCNDDVALGRFAQQMRQVVFYLGERDFPHAGFPNRASHVAASDLFTIAKISTVEFDPS